MNPNEQNSDKQLKSGYIIEHDDDVAVKQPGPHAGGGETTGFNFFKAVRDMDFVFKKRILHPGSAIGYHLQENDEIYYILSGEGELNMDGKKSVVKSGTAILTRPGTYHSLHQAGTEDLVLFIVYPKH
jgi:mannose-6-phosphate isomerase-like protein (cupin superfamily)